VVTERDGIPSATTDFSVSASVGQACTQAPHETHSEDRKSVPLALIRASKPRPDTVSAKVPCVSELARTQREHLQPVALNLDFSDAWRIPVRDAYERLLTDILRGRLSLFLRRDEVAAQWAFIDQLRGELQERAIRPLAYPAGSYGPPEATALAFRYGGAWSEALTLAG